MVRVKICGITSRADAWAAVDSGADALGFVFHRPSPRYVTPADARAIIRTLPPLVASVGVVVGGDPAELKRLASGCGLALLQVHGPLAGRVMGALKPFPVMPAIQVRTRRDLVRLRHIRAPLVLLDAWDPARPGGTGRRLDLGLFARGRPRVPFLLAGGLTPENVARAVRRVRPYGVDVSSGVERSPGHKDRRRMARFVRAAKLA